MPTNSIDLEFADGTYTFALKLPGIHELQEKCGIGIGGLFARVLQGRFVTNEGLEYGSHSDAAYKMADLTETIRQGLIGGGQGEADGQPVKVTSLVANRLVENYVVNAPLAQSWALAATILSALIEGYDPPKKKEDVTEEPMASEQMDGSTTREP